MYLSFHSVIGICQKPDLKTLRTLYADNSILIAEDLFKAELNITVEGLAT
jgi:hypothetical protein